jgi:hypothetical protein
MPPENRQPLEYAAPEPRDVQDDVRLYVGIAIMIPSVGLALVVAGLLLSKWLRT